MKSLLPPHRRKSLTDSATLLGANPLAVRDNRTSALRSQWEAGQRPRVRLKSLHLPARTYWAT